jgi:hypothetical protein
MGKLRGHSARFDGWFSFPSKRSFPLLARGDCQIKSKLSHLWQYVVSMAFIRDFLIGEADIASFSCYSKPPASAGGAFTIDRNNDAELQHVFSTKHFFNENIIFFRPLMQPGTT